MKLPKKLKILGYTYEIILLNDLREKHGASGLCASDSLKIFISSDMPLESQWSTLFHEICEAANDHMELKLKHTQITGLGETMWQVLNDNKLLKKKS